MLDEELLWLYEQMKSVVTNGIVVEIGVWMGRSSYAIAKGANDFGRNVELFFVDDFKGHDPVLVKKLKEKNVLKIFKDNMRQFDYTLIKKDSVSASKQFKNNSIDFLFIDGDHSYDGVVADLDAWWPKVRGVMCGHDYKADQYGVKKAVDEKFEIKNPVGSIWLV